MKFSKSKDQNSLFDFIDRGQEFSSRPGLMDRLNELIDLEAFCAPLVETLDYGDHAKRERPLWESAPIHTSEILHIPSLRC